MRMRFNVILAAALASFLVFNSLNASAGTTAPKTCCSGQRGNIDGKGIIDLVDLSSFVSYFLYGTYTLPCPDAANVNGQGGIDLPDLSMLVAYLIGGATTLLPCPGDTAYVSDTVRIASLRAVSSMFKSISNLPPDSFNAHMLAYLHGRPEFVDAGVSTSAGNVWARFSDGILLLVTNSFGQSLDTLPGDPLPPDTGGQSGLGPGHPSVHQSRQSLARVPSGTGDDLPQSVAFRVISPLGDAYPAIATTRSRLRSWLKSSNYIEASQLSSVYEMRKVGGEGLVCYFGHGGAGKLITAVDGEWDYGIWTSNSAETIDSIRLFSEDFVARRLCYCIGPNNLNATKDTVLPATRIGITSKFITYYWKPFAPNALVIMNACGSDSVPAFRNAIMAKGGPAYFGWSRTVKSKGTCFTSEYLIDRLLGANKAFPREDPKQRPFPVGDVYGDMQAQGFLNQPSGDSLNPISILKYYAGSSNFGFLAPSLAFMSVEVELGEQLFLEGAFGADPLEDGRVMVGGTPLVVTSWTPTEIRCDLPRDGAGSEGPVTVEVKGDYFGESPLTYRQSNIVNLTSWRIPFHYTHQEGGAKVVVDLHLHIRADIHAHRDVIHEPPANVVGVPFHHDLDSYGTFSASGSGSACVDACCWTDTWSGSGQIPVVEFATTTTGLIANGGIDPVHHTFTMALGAGVEDGINDHYCSCAPGCTDGQLGWVTDPSICEALVPQPYFTMYLNDNFDVLTGERTPSGIVEPTNYIYLFPTPPIIKLSWPETTASFAPDSSAAR